jgi:WD40 repeat protein
MKVDEYFALNLPQDKRVSRVKAASFHPLQNKIAIGFRRDIYEYDLISGSRVAQYTTESEINHLLHAHTHNVLIAALKNGCFSVFDLSTHTVTAFHIPLRSIEKKPVAYAAVSRTKPFLFYSRENATTVCGIQIFADSKQRLEYTHRKQVSCITTHPGKNLMASASIDGNIRIWDYVANILVASFDEFGTDKTQRSPVTALCFYSAKDSNPTANTPPPPVPLSARGHYHTGPTSVTGGDLLVTGTKNGRVQVWLITPTERRVVAIINLNEWIVSIFFHSSLPCLMVMNHKGCLKAVNVGHLISNFLGGSVPSMKGILTKFDMVDTFYAPLHDTSYHNTQKNLKSLIPAISVQMNENSGLFVFFGKNYQISNLNTPNVHGVIVSEYYPIFNIVDDSDFPGSTLPQCAQFSCTLDMFLSSKHNSETHNSATFFDDPEFEIPYSDILYMDTFTAAPHDILMKYNLATDSSKGLQLLKTSSSSPEYHRCIQIKTNRAQTLLLVFYEKQRQQSSYTADNRNRFFLALDLAKKGEIPPLESGKDGDFLEADNNDCREFFILDEDGMSIQVYELGSPTPVRTAKLAVKISRIFSCPFKKNINLYYNRANAILGFANDDLTFGMSKKAAFHLRKNEIPISVQWQKPYQSEQQSNNSGGFLIGLLTTYRVLILDEDLNILASVESPLQMRKSLYFQSCLWFGNVLLYNTCSAVYCLCPNMLEQAETTHSTFPLCTLEHANSVISGVLYDRIFFTCYRNNCPQMSMRYVNVVEPLILSIIALKQPHEVKLRLLQSVISKFDCRSVSERTLITLEHSGFADLASEMITHSVYEFSWNIRFRFALHSLQFEYAFELLRGQYQKTVVLEQVDSSPSGPFIDEGSTDKNTNNFWIDDGYCTENSEFYTYFLQLAELSAKHGYYNIAAKCYDIINDSWALLRLFSMFHKEAKSSNDFYVTPLSRLAMRCKNSPDLYAIYMACRIVLGNAYKETEEEEIFKNHKGNFGKRRINLGLSDMDGVEWPAAKPPVNVSKRSYDLGTTLKGIMKIKSEKSNLSQDPSLPNMSTDYDHIEPLSLTNLSQWMGYQASTTASEHDWDRVDFSITEFGAGAPKMARSDSISSMSEEALNSNRKTSTKAQKSNNAQVISTLDIAGHRGQLSIGGQTEEGLDTERDADGEDTISEANNNNANNNNANNNNAEDEEGFSSQPDIDKIRKEYMGGSSSEDSSSEDGEGDKQRKKRKLFRKLKIKDKTEVPSAAPKIDPSLFKLSGPSGVGIGGPTLGATSGLANPRASRRIRGRPVFNMAELNQSGVADTGSDVTSSTSNADESTPTTTKTQDTPPVVTSPMISNVNPADALKNAMSLLESGQYRDARTRINEAINALVNDNSEVLKKNNLLLCIRYKLLVMMLAHNQRIETSNSPTQVLDLARNSFLLAQIKVTNKHQVICRNMASKRNIQAGNYGLAAKIIQLLLPITPPQHRAEVQQRLDQCAAQNFRNQDKELELAAEKAEQELQERGETSMEFLPIKFCWRTFRLITNDSQYISCSYCDALYLPVEALELDQKCHYCHYGSLERK